jgi:hypothetical protein
MMFLEMGEKFLEVRCNGLSTDAEFLAQLFGNLSFRVALFQKLQHPRTDEIQPVHLPVEDVEDDGSVLTVGGTHVFGQLHRQKTPSPRRFDLSD